MFDTKETLYIAISVACAFLAFFQCLNFTRIHSKYPFANYNKSDWTYNEAKKKFVSQARSLITEGMQTFAGPFNIVTGLGPLLLLTPDYIDSIDNQPALDLNKFEEAEFLSNFETFRVVRTPPHGLIDEIVNKSLNRSLPKLIKPVSDEMAKCLHDTWGDSEEWHDASPTTDVMQWVSRLSCRALNGEPLTSNEEWLRITAEFTAILFDAITAVKYFPPPLRWIAEILLPKCRKVRSEYKRAARLLQPVLDKREALRKEGVSQEDLPNDSIEWFRNAADGRPYNALDLQLALAVSAIFTSSDLLGQALIHLALYKETIAPLRQEAIGVLEKHGLSKSALIELHLLDSFLKETQRVKPMGMTTLHRLATTDVKLANDVLIKKGERCAVSSHRMWSSETYKEPDKFDAFRFVELRKLSDWKSKATLISTSRDHMGFSHGKHACPGRFFAADELKIAMLHILFKYDISVEDVKTTGFIEHGSNMMVNPEAVLKIRRRVPEIDLDVLVKST